ncbi:MAG: lmo0937 family membrane protein [Flavobacteriaceae bacterium]
MRGLSYIVISILVLTWFISFFVYSAGGFIHILLVLALMAILPTLAGAKRL